MFLRKTVIIVETSVLFTKVRVFNKVCTVVIFLFVTIKEIFNLIRIIHESVRAVNISHKVFIETSTKSSLILLIKIDVDFFLKILKI